MRKLTIFLSVLIPWWVVLVAPTATAGQVAKVDGQQDELEIAEDVADVPAEDLRAGGDERKRYFLMPPKDSSPPKTGYKLLLVLPGGDGSAEFTSFVRRIYKHAVPGDCIVAQLVAVQWTKKQAEDVVWPTSKHRGEVDGMKFTTEELVAAVVQDTKKRFKVDPRSVFTLGWSSGGPACYAISMEPKCGVTGSFVAMSVFKPDQLPSLKNARGHAYYILHSPEDWIPIDHAKEAKEKLAKAGAATELQTYPGGHGWKGDVYGMMRKGIDWLSEQTERRGKGR